MLTVTPHPPRTAAGTIPARMQDEDQVLCELCGRAERLSKHHLIPQSRHHNKRNKKQFSREDVRQRIAWLCRPCHSNLHALLDNKELEREYNTIERLSRHPGVARFSAWISKRPPGTKVPIRRNSGR